MREWGRGSWVVALMLGGLLGYAWYAARQGPPRPAAQGPVVPGSNPLVPAVIYYHHTEYIRNKRDEIQWKLQVDKAILHQNGSVTLEGVQQATYFRNNEPVATLRADRAYRNQQTQNIVIQGHIRVASPLGLLLECEELRWIQGEQKMVCLHLKRVKYGTATLETKRLYFYVEKDQIECPDPLRVRDVNASARAQRATANLKTHWISLYGPAEVSFMAPLEETVAIPRSPALPALAKPRKRWGGRARPWIAGMLWGLVGMPGWAEQSPAAPAAQARPAEAGAKKSSRKKVVLDIGEGGTAQTNFKTNAFKARKNVMVTIPDDEVKIWCDQADYTGDEGPQKGILTASGNLRLKDPENEITAKLLTVYTEEKRAVLTDNVVLVHTPKDKPPAGERSRADEYRYTPTTVTCDRIEYWYKAGQRKAVATGNLKFKQKDRRGTAGKATFYNEDQIVDLEGQVRFEDDKGQKAEAPLVRILLEEDEILITGPVRLEVYTEEEKEEGGAAPAPPPPGSQAPPLPGFEEEGREGSGGGGGGGSGP